MNKRYLILKKKPIEAQSGWATGLVKPLQSKGIDGLTNGNTQITPAMLQSATGAPEVPTTAPAVDNGLNVGGLASAGVSAGLNIGSTLAGNAMDKNSRTDGFGNEIFDDKDAKLTQGKEVMDQAAKWGSMGASVGALIPGGALVGGALGAAGGAIAGIFSGKKKAEEADKAYKKSLDLNKNASYRNDDIMASQALLGKQGRKLGKFLIQKKKPRH